MSFFKYLHFTDNKENMRIRKHVDTYHTLKHVIGPFNLVWTFIQYLLHYDYRIITNIIEKPTLYRIYILFLGLRYIRMQVDNNNIVCLVICSYFNNVKLPKNILLKQLRTRLPTLCYSTLYYKLIIETAYRSKRFIMLLSQ